MDIWEEFFQQLTYKPNFRFEYVPPEEICYPKIVIKMQVPNSRGEGMVVVRHTAVLPPIHDERERMEFVRSHLISMERHEVDEWFRHRDELIFDPHKEEV